MLQVLDYHIRKPRKKHFGGGSFRAFVRHRTFGITGRPNMSQIAGEYRDLKARGELPPEIIRLGSAARRVARAQGPGEVSGSRFGLTTRQLQRKRHQLAQQAFHRLT